jgi:hypothetical protein
MVDSMHFIIDTLKVAYASDSVALGKLASRAVFYSQQDGTFKTYVWPALTGLAGTVVGFLLTMLTDMRSKKSQKDRDALERIGNIYKLLNEIDKLTATLRNSVLTVDNYAGPELETLCQKIDAAERTAKDCSWSLSGSINAKINDFINSAASLRVTWIEVSHLSDTIFNRNAGIPLPRLEERRDSLTKVADSHLASMRADIGFIETAMSKLNR